MDLAGDDLSVIEYSEGLLFIVSRLILDSLEVAEPLSGCGLGARGNRLGFPVRGVSAAR